MLVSLERHSVEVELRNGRLVARYDGSVSHRKMLLVQAIPNTKLCRMQDRTLSPTLLSTPFDYVALLSRTEVRNLVNNIQLESLQ